MILQRITNEHYNVHDESGIRGSVHQLPDGKWYGTSWGQENIPFEKKKSTGLHDSRHKAAWDLLNES